MLQIPYSLAIKIFIYNSDMMVPFQINVYK